MFYHISSKNKFVKLINKRIISMNAISINIQIYSVDFTKPIYVYIHILSIFFSIILQDSTKIGSDPQAITLHYFLSIRNLFTKYFLDFRLRKNCI